MKKFIFIFIIVIFLGCKNEKIDYESLLAKALNELNLSNETSSDVYFPNVIIYENVTINLEYESDNEAISKTGKVTTLENDVIVNVTVKGKVLDFTLEKVFTIKVLKNDSLGLLERAFLSLDLPFEASFNISLPKIIELENENIITEYQSSDINVLKKDGTIKPKELVDVNVLLEVKLTHNDISITKEVSIIVLSYKTIVDRAAEQIVLPEEINSDIELLEQIGDVTCFWLGNEYISKKGVVSFVDEAVSCILEVTLFHKDGDYMVMLEFKIKVLPYVSSYRFKFAEESLNIPEFASSNLTLPISFSYGVSGVWESSNLDVIDNLGVVSEVEEDTEVILTLTLSISESDIKEIVFLVVVPSKYEKSEVFDGHNLIDRTHSFSSSRLNGLVKVDNKIELRMGELSGYYESKEFTIKEFTSVVGSFSCITSKDSTATLEVSVRVDGVWSKYFSYGNWGLGKSNYYYDSSDSIAKLSTDEIIVSNSKKANGVKYKITLKINNLMIDSPKLSLVALALLIPDYKPVINSTNFPLSFDIDLPKLYQHDVPTIGSVICSATTTTMLLNYKGFSFKDKGYQYEHEYMAYLVADPGHNNPTYGNWSYNMITAGAFGVDAYVARLYSFEEVMYYLVNVGPIGCSIRGNFGSYTTGGHLIVVRGYRVEDNQTIVICNDPNIKGVYYEVSLETFNNCYRNISYIIE